ncbi:hypothetical protein ACI2KR_06940 [Pseudomonas luteola]
MSIISAKLVFVNDLGDVSRNVSVDIDNGVINASDITDLNALLEHSERLSLLYDEEEFRVASQGSLLVVDDYDLDDFKNHAMG